MIHADIKLKPGMRLSYDCLSTIVAVIHDVTATEIHLSFAHQPAKGISKYTLSQIKNIFTLMPSSELARNADDT